MSSRLIVPPVELAVSMEAARRQARANGTSLDDEIKEKVQGFTEEAEHETARAFISQTWAETLDRFPAGQRGGAGAIQLNRSPVASVLSVTFYDAAGVQQALHPEDFMVDDKSEPGYIVPAPGKSWPATADRINAVEVQYVAGYGPNADSVPAAIKQYILGKLEDAYYPNPNSQYLCRLLDRHRVYL